MCVCVCVCVCISFSFLHRTACLIFILKGSFGGFILFCLGSEINPSSNMLLLLCTHITHLYPLFKVLCILLVKFFCSPPPGLKRGQFMSTECLMRQLPGDRKSASHRAHRVRNKPLIQDNVCGCLEKNSKNVLLKTYLGENVSNSLIFIQCKYPFFSSYI